MKKLFSFFLFGAMLSVFSACEQSTPTSTPTTKTTTTTTEVYQVVLVTDNLEGATATVSKTNEIRFADEVFVTVTPEESYVWESEPKVSASHAICKSSTEKDGVYTYVFTAFEDNSVIQVIGVAVLPDNDTPDVNGHAYVDFGLTSGTLWATCNVGATNPEDYGDYFAWGETTTKSTYYWSTYKYCNGSSSTLTKYCTSSSYGTVDNKTTLEASDDAATANWGGAWRMPTRAEQQELFNECTWSWTTLNGVYGYRVTSKKDTSKSIFLPAAGYRGYTSLLSAGSNGYYWSSSLDSSSTSDAWYLDFISGNKYTHYYYRCYGQSVRPVCSSKKE